jgi:hypothetical protein
MKKIRKRNVGSDWICCLEKKRHLIQRKRDLGKLKMLFLYFKKQCPKYFFNTTIPVHLPDLQRNLKIFSV